MCFVVLAGLQAWTQVFVEFRVFQLDLVNLDKHLMQKNLTKQELLALIANFLKKDERENMVKTWSKSKPNHTKLNILTLIDNENYFFYQKKLQC